LKVIKLYLSAINFRTLIALGLAALATWLTLRFEIYFHVDLTMLSIAIIFPLVFAIRMSFRRREKALEHLSDFRSGLKTINDFAYCDQDLPDAQKEELHNILAEISDTLIEHLRSNKETISDLDQVMNKINQFVIQNSDYLKNKLRDRIFRFMNDCNEGLENLHAINTHRTPISLNAYCRVFVFLFPFVYAPSIAHDLDYYQALRPTVIYGVVLLTEFILIALYNIQYHLEFPFDNKGVDDIKLESFRFKR
jgi:hypothetical protein